jgi:hypothetical protein
MLDVDVLHLLHYRHLLASIQVSYRASSVAVDQRKSLAHVGNRTLPSSPLLFAVPILLKV